MQARSLRSSPGLSCSKSTAFLVVAAERPNVYRCRGQKVFSSGGAKCLGKFGMLRSSGASRFFILFRSINISAGLLAASNVFLVVVID
jgi:hypothetical protein